MMTLEGAIIARLERAKAFWDPVGGRVDWGASVDGTPHPRVVLTVTSGLRPDHYTGPDVRPLRLQLDVYSTVSADEARTIAEASVSALQPEEVVEGWDFRRAPEVDGPTDSGDQTDTLYVHRAMMDYSLLLSEASEEEGN